VYHISDILHKFLSRKFVSGLRTLTPFPRPQKSKNLKKNFFLKTRFFSPWIRTVLKNSISDVLRVFITLLNA